MSARKRAQSGADIDWYLISIDRLKQLIVLIVLVLVGVAGFLYYRSLQTPNQKAQKAIEAADSSLNELATRKDFSKYRNDFDRAKARVDQAKKLLAKGSPEEAEAAAIEAQAITRTALAGIGERESDAQFLTVEGQVEFQKGGSGDWKKADRNTPLFNGDWVKTGSGASAELFFSNGSIYTIGANALLEVYAAVNPTTNRKDNAVQMRVGRLEINTTDEVGTVRTPGTQVVVDAESTAQVDVNAQEKQTRIVALKGATSVSSAKGGSAVPLGKGEQLAASDQGDLGQKSNYLLPPALLIPNDNQVYQGTSEMTVEFNWAPRPEAHGYQLQVSRSRLFSVLEIDAKRVDARAKVKVTSEGSFYWRVASIDETGKPGPASQFRRFRVTGFGTNATPTGSGDTTPPTLTVEKPQSLGGPLYLIKGKAEAGATVFVDDLEISIDPDGSFQKLVSFTKVGLNTVVVRAVDPAANQSLQRVNIYVEE
jgi:uncharacterized protein YpmB